MNDKITVYRDGRCTTEPEPDFLAEGATLSTLLPVRVALDRIADKLSARLNVIDFGDANMPLAIFELGEERGWYIELSSPHNHLCAVWIPDFADLLPFLSQHGFAFVEAAGSVALNSQLDRLATMLHTIIEEHLGITCDPHTGESNRRIHERMRREHTRTAKTS